MSFVLQKTFVHKDSQIQEQIKYQEYDLLIVEFGYNNYENLFTIIN